MLKTPFFRFCVVGAGGFVVDAGLLLILVSGMGFGPLAGRVVSILIAMTFTWWFNRRWTFRSADRRQFVEWGRYAMANGAGALVNYAVFTAIVVSVPVVPLIVAVCLGTGAGLAVNYLGSRYLVFRNGMTDSVQ